MYILIVSFTTKDKAEQGYYADENSASEYAADRYSTAAERITEEGVHQFNKQGQKSVKTTQENIVNAKDKVADFKQKRAATAKATVAAIKAAVKATVAAVKAIIAGTKALIVAIAAGGWVAVVVIIVQ